MRENTRSFVVRLILVLTFLVGGSLVYAQSEQGEILPEVEVEVEVEVIAAPEEMVEELFVATTTEDVSTTTEEVIAVDAVVSDIATSTPTTTETEIIPAEENPSDPQEQIPETPIEDEPVPRESFPLSPQQCLEEEYRSLFANLGECMRATR